MNEDVRAQKDALENLNTRKSTSRKIPTGILSKNSELKPNLSSKSSRECRSSRSIRSRIWTKTRVKLFPNFTRHHLITHSNTIFQFHFHFFHVIFIFILLHEKFLQFDWLRAVVFKLNLKYQHVKITNLLWVVVVVVIA